MIVLIVIVYILSRSISKPSTQPVHSLAQIEREHRAILREQERQCREVERLAREQERQARILAKHEERIALAEMELEHIEQQRAQYMALYDRLTAEMDTATPARQNAITRQIIALDEKLYRLDTRRLRAYNAANAA